MEINWSNIENKIEDMIKDKIRAEGLVKTGRLLNSIKVIADGNGGFAIEAEDYFKYLDDEHGISNFVFNSPELISFIENDIAKQAEEEIAKDLKSKTKTQQ